MTLLALTGSVAMLVLLNDLNRNAPLARFFATGASWRVLKGASICLLLHFGKAVIISAILVAGSLVVYGIAH